MIVTVPNRRRILFVEARFGSAMARSRIVPKAICVTSLPSWTCLENDQSLGNSSFGDFRLRHLVFAPQAEGVLQIFFKRRSLLEFSLQTRVRYL